jgi:hypothetical protein
MDLFRISASGKSARVREIKDQLTAMLELTEESTVFVTELACLEEGCPPVETVIAVLRDRATQKFQFKLHKPVLDITEEDLAGIYRNYQELQHHEDGQNGNNR